MCLLKILKSGDKVHLEGILRRDQSITEPITGSCEEYLGQVIRMKRNHLLSDVTPARMEDKNGGMEEKLETSQSQFKATTRYNHEERLGLVALRP